ncbi:MAG TPA: hypothetical protein VNL91_03635, partial [Thermoanaerobaculia bacterium]|nr:hypothetical protein [Thermoanaerobaculia bacterium]
ASRFEASAAPLLVPFWDGAPQMLCAGFAPEILPVIEARIERGALDLRGLMPVAEIVEERDLRARHAGEPLRNVNTPEELEALRERT